MIMAKINPGEVPLEIHAQNLDGSAKTALAEAMVRVYHIENGVEIEDLASTPLLHAVGSSIYRYVWTPSSLAEGQYVAEYTLVDLDGVTAIFPEDIVISEDDVCPTVEEIDDKLSDEHGDGSWEGGGVCGQPKLIPGE
jgi:hypothetical protein